MAASKEETPEETPKGKKITQLTYPDITMFDNLDLSDNLFRGIYCSAGFEKPSLLQQKAIFPIMNHRDVMVQVEGQAGTGKTTACLIGMLAQIDFDSSLPSPQALVLCPTRELARQANNAILLIADYCLIRTSPLLGQRIPELLRSLKQNPHVVIGTPGRVQMFLERKFFDLSHLKVIVFDDTDEILSSGFKDQIYEIFKYAPRSSQVVICSATFSSDVLELAEKLTINPLRIEVRRPILTLEGTKQFYVDVEKEDRKLETLCDLYETASLTQTIVYCNTRNKAEFVSDQLKTHEYSVSCLTDIHSPQERDAIIDEFQTGSSRVFVTTDQFAQSIDVTRLSAIINYDLPTNRESYLHQIGRSGKYGKRALAITLVTSEESQDLQAFRSYYNTIIDELPINFSI